MKKAKERVSCFRGTASNARISNRKYMLQGAQLESRPCGCIPITYWLTKLHVVLPWWFLSQTAFGRGSIVQILSTRTCRTIVVGEVLISGPKISCKSYCTPTGRHVVRGARAYNGGLWAELPAGVQGAKPPVGLKGQSPLKLNVCSGRPTHGRKSRGEWGMRPTESGVGDANANCPPDFA